MLALVLTVPISVTVNTNVGLICAAGTRAVKGSFSVQGGFEQQSDWLALSADGSCSTGTIRWV